MTYAPKEPLEVPPFQVQPLIANLFGDDRKSPTRASTVPPQVSCAQALGSEIYVGCSNGELLRFALQADDPNKPPSYALLSKQVLQNDKRIEELVLLPCISRALVLSDRQIHFYTLPSLDPIPNSIIKPIRSVVAFAVDHQHICRPPPDLSVPTSSLEPVPISVIKRSSIALYILRERLILEKELPLPGGGMMARRTGPYLCIADQGYYNIVNLVDSSFLPVIPVSQEPGVKVEPFIIVINRNEFLILSWTGGGTIGVFISGNGDPVRGTLTLPSHPRSICLDYPYITSLLPDESIVIHDIGTQEIVYTIPPSTLPSSPSSSLTSSSPRVALSPCPNGYLVPTSQQVDKMRRVAFPLVRKTLQKTVATDAEIVKQAENMQL